MKIGLVSFHTFSKPGGVKNHILGLAKEFKKKGIEIKIIVPRRKAKENYGEDVIILGTSLPFNLFGTQGDLCFNFNARAITKLFEKEKFDVLHFHNFIIPSALQMIEKSESLNILTFHASLEGVNRSNTFNTLFNLYKKLIYKKVDGIITVSKFVSNYFNDFNGPRAVIPNGIDLNKFNPNVPKIKRFKGNKINILFVGRIEERKGLIYLLKAYEILLKKFQNLIRLIIVGDGPQREECEDFVKKRKLKNVFFVGKKNEDEVPYYFSTADIFCAPSLFGESFGIVLLEAMATKKPVVAFANNGYRELLEGKAAEQFLVKPKDYIDLAKKLEILIKDKKLREEVGEKLYIDAQSYSWPVVANMVLDFYNYCLIEKSKKNTRDKK